MALARKNTSANSIMPYRSHDAFLLKCLGKDCSWECNSVDGALAWHTEGAGWFDPAPHKLDAVVYTYNPNMQEVKS